MLKVVITCEHATNFIPDQFVAMFHDHQELLASHKGRDIGAMELAELFSRRADYTFFATVSRLLIEANRSLHHPDLFSSISKTLPQAEKKQIIADYYLPYRNQVSDAISRLLQKGDQVLHLSVHSFSPLLNGKMRTTDVGLLYDPTRRVEKNIAYQWRQKIHENSNEFRVRFNYPYRGQADGFVTALRKLYAGDKYFGLELEVNQKYYLNPSSFNRLKEILIVSFGSIIDKSDLFNRSVV